jgi:general secretion pathway protein D
MNVSLPSAFVLAILAVVLIGCDTWPESGYDRPAVAPPQAEPLTGPSRPVRTEQRLPPEDEGEPVQRVVQRGTGALLSPPLQRAQTSVTTDASGGVMLNVVDGELREVVRMVLESALHANYVIDPSVGGRITVQTTRPLPPQDLVPVLDAVLRMNGAALVQTGDLFKVVPIDQAISAGAMADVAQLPSAGSPGFGVQVVPLRFVSATELGPVLEPFRPPGGAIQVDAVRNLLLLAGSSDQLASLRDLVSIFDVDWMRGMSFGLFPLDNAAAADLATELDQIFGGTEAGPLAGVVKVVPIERLNSVLVVSSQPSYLEQAELWVQRLDRTSDADEPQIYVYPVQNSRASNLAEVLSGIFGAEAATVTGTSLLAPGQEATQMQSELGTTAEQTSQQTSPEETETGARPRRAQPTPSIAAPLSPTTTAFGPQQGEEGQPETRIIADDSTNSLVVRALPEDYRKIRDAIERLDTLPLQVLIEATVAEVTLSNQLRYGVEWFFRSGDFAATFSQQPNVSTPVQGAFPGFSAIFSNADVRVVLSALEQVSDVNVISSPQLLVLDNQTARLQVGDQVPITVQSATPITGGVNTIVNSIELRDTGVILTVTPRVNAGGLVILEIQQEVSNVVRAETVTQSELATPTISQRLVSSTVAVQSGQTIALGGLITDNRNRSRSGVPILSSIPVIGVLFSTRNNTNDRTELLVLLTPRVIDSAERAQAVTDELRRRLTGILPPGRVP